MQRANSERDREIADVGSQADQARFRHAKQKAAKGKKTTRPAREAASDGTAGATGTPMARKIKEG